MSQSGIGNASSASSQNSKPASNLGRVRRPDSVSLYGVIQELFMELTPHFKAVSLTKLKAGLHSLITASIKSMNSPEPSQSDQWQGSLKPKPLKELLLQKRNLKPFLIVLAILYGIVLWSNFIYSLKHQENASGTAGEQPASVVPVEQAQNSAAVSGPAPVMQNGFLTGSENQKFNASQAGGYARQVMQSPYGGGPYPSNGYAQVGPPVIYGQSAGYALPGGGQPQFQQNGIVVAGTNGGNWAPAYNAAVPVTPAGSYIGMQSGTYQAMPYANAASAPAVAPGLYSSQAPNRRGALAGYPPAMHDSINQGAFGAFPTYSHGQAPVVRHRVVVTR